MAQSGDWITPRINGVKYFEKPPLLYWIEATQLNLFGIGEFSGRVPAMLFMIALCLLTAAAGEALYGRKAGVLAALMLATSALGFSLSRIVLLDGPVSFFLTGCLFAFLFAVRTSEGRRRTMLLMAMAACAAGATMTKGLIGIVIPGLVIGGWIAMTGRWTLLLHLRLFSCALLFLALTVPWHVLVQQHNPGFFQFYFIHEHFTRYLSPSHRRTEPWWFFFAVLAAGLMPWTLFLAQSLRGKLQSAWARRREDGTTLYLLLWVLLPFVFFSLSQSKLIPYLLPLFPPLCLFLSQYFVKQLENWIGGGFRRSVAALATLCVALAGAAPAAWLLWAQKAPQTAETLLPDVIVLACLYAATGILLGLMLWRKAAAQRVITVLFIFAALQALVVDFAASRYKRDSVKEFALTLKPLLRPGDEVACFHRYYQDIPVYLDRNVTVVRDDDEMAFGISVEPRTREWMLEDAEFWRRWLQPGHRMFLVARKDNWPKERKPEGAVFLPVMESERHVLMTNDPDFRLEAP